MLELLLAPAFAVGGTPQTVATLPQELPRPVSRMISAAIRSNDEAQLAAVVAAAKVAFPEFSGQIDTLVAELKTPVEPLRIAPLVVPAPKPVEIESPGYWDDFNAELALNAAETKGNSDTLFLGLRSKVNLMRKAQIHRLEVFANQAEANGVENQSNWGASYQLDTLWNDEYFGYVRGSMARDDFAGFETDAFAGVGAGAYLVQTEAVTLRSEVGPGYRYLKVANDGDEIGGVGLYGATELDWLIREDLSFEVDAKVNISGPTSTFHPTFRMNTAVSDHVSAGLSYDIRYESNPPLMSENLDRILRFDVKYSY